MLKLSILVVRVKILASKRRKLIQNRIVCFKEKWWCVRVAQLKDAWAVNRAVGKSWMCQIIKRFSTLHCWVFRIATNESSKYSVVRHGFFMHGGSVCHSKIHLWMFGNGNSTEFQFIYHLKGLSKPSMMLLFPQLLNRYTQSCKAWKFHKEEIKKVRVSVIFSCHKLKDNDI